MCKVNLSILVHRQLKVLKDKISDSSKTNYELEREVRFFDQRIGLLINHKKAVEVSCHNIRRVFVKPWVLSLNMKSSFVPCLFLRSFDFLT